jgi:glycosyltransferase involved in cell wall biosynthesis
MLHFFRKFNTAMFLFGFWFSFIVVIFLLKPTLLFLKWLIQNKKKNSILFFENFPVENAGYYYRSKVWEEKLNTGIYTSKVLTLYKSKNKWEAATQKRMKLFIICSLWIRIIQIFKSLRYEKIIVRRELLFFNEYGNLFLDKLLIKLHPNCILDFDDDIGASKNEPRKINNLIGKILYENGNKFNDSLKLYRNFIVGSQYLKELVLKKNVTANIVVIPTCVNFIEKKKKDISNLNSVVVFGWSGITNNMKLLDPLIPIFNNLSKNFKFSLTVISGAPYVSPIANNFPINSVKWSLNNDMENISKITIGLMPLEDNIMTKGKCGFKLIQYMSLGIPSIGQNITINKEIIPDKNYGWLVSNIDEWENALLEVLQMKTIELENIGLNAKQHILNNYTFESNYFKLVEFITSIRA